VVNSAWHAQQQARPRQNLGKYARRDFPRKRVGAPRMNLLAPF
jgi:hypothetical protein